MHLRLKKGSYEYIDSSDYCVHEPFSNKGRWNSVFGNGNPIHLEIGSGRGSFITQKAERCPDVNFVAVELYASPMYRAIKKAEGTGCRNLLFIRMDAQFLADVFDRGEVSVIYLNFSDPWPKSSRPNKRLTSGHYLSIYDSILSPGGHIEFKTDNCDFFEFSLGQAQENGWECSEINRDLHSTGNPDWNIVTDYEAAFVEKGVRINRVVLSRQSK